MKSASRYIVCSLFLFCLHGSLPPFEGEIDYDVHFESKLPTLPVSRLTVMFGVKAKYFIRQGSYKTMMDGQLFEMQLYDPLRNRLYNKMTGTDTLVWVDAALNRDSVVSFRLLKNADTVLGHVCDVLDFTTLSGSNRYSYSADLPLDAGRFRNHRYGNWAFFCNEAGAVPLRMKVENAQFIMLFEATVIRPMKLDSAFFAVPAGVVAQAPD